MAGEEVAKKYQNAIFLAGSASAEFFADIALCPFEAVKVRGRAGVRGLCVGSRQRQSLQLCPCARWNIWGGCWCTAGPGPLALAPSEAASEQALPVFT